MQESWLSRGSRIVLRLRFVFAFICGTFLASLLIEVALMRNHSVAMGHLTENSVPAFSHSHQIERSLKSLLLALHETSSILDETAFVELSQKLDLVLNDLRAGIFSLPPGIVNGDIDRMASTLEEIEEVSAQTLEFERARLQLEQDLAQFDARMVELRLRISDLLEAISYDTSLSLMLPVLRDEQSTPILRPDVQKWLVDGVGQAVALTELTLGVEAAIDTAIHLRSLRKTAELDGLGRALRHRLRGLALMVGQLDATPERTQIAAEIKELNTLVFAPQGILNTARTQIGTLDRLAKLHDQLEKPMAQMSSLSANVVELAKVSVKDSLGGLARTASQLTGVLSVTILVNLVLISAAMYFIVERQINQRMPKLTKAVLSIASGETRTVVNIQGDDEIGEMAKALEVFKDNAEELHRSNAELERFAYVAAHDLRSPLRAIQDLAAWTIEDECTRLSAEGRHNMELLSARVQRMNLLLSDLLQYSRIGTEVTEEAIVDIGEIVESLADLLDPNKAFDVKYIGRLQKIETFATPLYQVLMNLIGNGIKHHDMDTGKIIVDAWIEGSRVVMSVTDDGEGIPEQYRERVFQLFQTLRSRDEVEGSGLGLSIIRKLVENHGGTVTIESVDSDARGVKFVFDLPARFVDPMITEKAA